MAKIKRHRINVWISLTESELEKFESLMHAYNFSNKATFMKWIAIGFIRQAQIVNKTEDQQ